MHKQRQRLRALWLMYSFLSISQWFSTWLIDRLDQGADVTIGKGKGLSAAWVIRMIRNMVGHDHVRVFDLPVSYHRFNHVDVALVGIDFDEVVALAADIAKVDVEDFLARSEVLDDVEDFL